MLWSRSLLAGTAALLGLCITARGEDARPIVQQAVKTEVAADAADHTHWLYHEVDRKPDANVEQWVAEANKGQLTRLVKKNGVPVSKAAQRNGMNEFIQSADAQAKQRKADEHDDEQASEMLKMLPGAFLWTKTGEQGNNMVLHFKPNPQFHPPTRQARVFAAMAGEMKVDKTQHRIVSLKGRMIHDVKFWGGALGSLQAGGSFDVERRNTGGGEWQITETHIHIRGRALIFKSISEEEDDVKSQFKQLSGNISLENAESLLMKQNG